MEELFILKKDLLCYQMHHNDIVTVQSQMAAWD